MGLVLNDYNLSNGLVSETAYFKIEFVGGSKRNMTLNVNVYVSREASYRGVTPIEQKSFDFIPDTSDESKNYHKQGYDNIKSLPEFENAIDVFEEGQAL